MESLISVSVASASGVHSVLRPAAATASSISLSFGGGGAPARSIRSSGLTVVSQVQGIKPGRGNTNRSTPSKGSPSSAPTATSTPRPEMAAPAGATTCIAASPDGSSSDSSTTGRRSSNSTHQTSPRCMRPPGQETTGECYAGRHGSAALPGFQPLVMILARVGDLETSWLPSRARPADHETGSKTGGRSTTWLGRADNRIVNISCAIFLAQDMLTIVTNESSPDHRSLALSDGEHPSAGGRERSSAAWSGGPPRRPVAVFRHRAVAAAKPSGDPPSLARVRRGGAQGVALTPRSVRSRRCHTCPSAHLRAFNTQHHDSTRTQYRARSSLPSERLEPSGGRN